MWTTVEKYYVIVKMHELKLKNKHNQAVSFKNTYMCYKTIFQKMEGTGTYNIYATDYLLGKCKDRIRTWHRP